MKRLAVLLTVAVFGVSMISAADATNSTTTQIKHGAHFVDSNGDGYNDNAPDHDKDGVPNGVDPDYKRPHDGSGKGKGQGGGHHGKKGGCGGCVHASSCAKEAPPAK